MPILVAEVKFGNFLKINLRISGTTKHHMGIIFVYFHKNAVHDIGGVEDTKL